MTSFFTIINYLICKTCELFKLNVFHTRCGGGKSGGGKCPTERGGNVRGGNVRREMSGGNRPGGKCPGGMSGYLKLQSVNF